MAVNYTIHWVPVKVFTVCHIIIHIILFRSSHRMPGFPTVPSLEGEFRRGGRDCQIYRRIGATKKGRKRDDNLWWVFGGGGGVFFCFFLIFGTVGCVNSFESLFSMMSINSILALKNAEWVVFFEMGRRQMVLIDMFPQFMLGSLFQMSLLAWEQPTVLICIDW